MRSKSGTKKNINVMQMIGSLVGWYRVTAGLTQQQVSERLTCSVDKVSSLEQGRRPLHPNEAQQLDHLFDTKGALSVLLQEIPEHTAIPYWALLLVECEQRARNFYSYEPQVLPGLLQTEEYAHAVLANCYPPPDDEEFQRRLTTRLDRQRLLRRVPLAALCFIVEEHVLTRPIGGRECLRRQLAHLRECAELPNVTVLVMPHDRETHAGLDGPMALLETRDLERLGYVECQRGTVFVEDAEKVANLHERYGMLRSQALSPEASKSLLDKLLGEK